MQYVRDLWLTSKIPEQFWRAKSVPPTLVSMFVFKHDSWTCFVSFCVSRSYDVSFLFALFVAINFVWRNYIATPATSFTALILAGSTASCRVRWANDLSLMSAIQQQISNLSSVSAEDSYVRAFANVSISCRLALQDLSAIQNFFTVLTVKCLPVVRWSTN